MSDSCPTCGQPIQGTPLANALRAGPRMPEDPAQLVAAQREFEGSAGPMTFPPDQMQGPGAAPMPMDPATLVALQREFAGQMEPMTPGEEGLGDASFPAVVRRPEDAKALVQALRARGQRR